MEKLSKVLVIALLLNHRIGYSCIGLAGTGLRECYSGYPKTDIAKPLKTRDEEKRFLQQTRIQSPRISTIDNESNEFLECCRQRGLPEVCLWKCSYNNYDENILRRMFLQVDPCPLLFASDMHFCAAQGQDHRQCCAMNGVTTTLAGHKCLVFCDQRVQSRTILDLSYLPCFEQFTNIKKCFWNWAQRRYHLVEISKRSKINDSLGSTDRMKQLNKEQRPLPLNSYP